MLLALAVPAMMWLYYFSPAVLYSLAPGVLEDVLIFDEKYVVQSMAIMLAFYGLFTAGLEWVLKNAQFDRRVQYDGPFVERLNSAGLVVVSAAVVALGFVAFLVRPPPVLDQVDSFIDVYEDSFASQIANTFSSVVVVWAIFLSLLVRNVVYGSSIVWLTAAAPGIVSIFLAVSGTGRRQSVVFAALVAVFPLIQRFRRNHIPSLVAFVGAVIIALAVVDARRSSLGGGSFHLSIGDILTRPILNFANTTSFHARCVYYYGDHNFLWGRSYAVNLVPAIPLLSKLMYDGNVQVSLYSLDPVRATLDFAYDRQFGMGGSPFSELYANFSLFGCVLAVGLGMLYGRWVILAWSSRATIWGSLLSSVLLLFTVWYIRSSLQGSIGMLRFVIVAGVVTVSLRLFGLITGGKESANQSRTPRPVESKVGQMV